jgi:hypothetical protein
MMKVNKIFVVGADIARRAGVIAKCYRTKEGRYVVSQSDLRMLRLEPEEYITGIDAEIVDLETAKMLIADGGSQIGEPVDASAEMNAVARDDAAGPREDNPAESGEEPAEPGEEGKDAEAATADVGGDNENEE